MSERTSRPPHTRSRARSWALQLLYGWEITGEGALAAHAARALEHRRMSPRYRPHVDRILSLVESNREAIDRLLGETMPNWKLGRLDAIDRNILRIGIAELLYADEVPPKVAIHEAILLAGRYGSAESPRFVNGVLDAIHRKVAPSSV